MKLYDAQGREKLPPQTLTLSTTAAVGRNLGQALPASRVLATLYVVPSGVRATGVKVMCANRSATTARFRIAHAISGVVDAPEQYLYVDEAIPGNKTFEAVLGFEMSPTDELRAYSDTGQVVFNVYGQEISS